MRVRCQASVTVYAAKHLHKQCVKREMGGETDRSPQLARKAPPSIWSLSQDATAGRASMVIRRNDSGKEAEGF